MRLVTAFALGALSVIALGLAALAFTIDTYKMMTGGKRG